VTVNAGPVCTVPSSSAPMSLPSPPLALATVADQPDVESRVGPC
jgi:hypothetical protein